MIHILGAGAVGCLWAAHLSTSNLSEPHDVCFVSSKAILAHNKTKHFTLIKPYDNSTSQFNIPILYKDDITTSIEILLVCTKSYDAFLALEQLRPKLNKHTTIILFQNGLGSQFDIIEAFPDNIILAAVSTEGANRNSHAEIIHAGQGLTQIGILNQADTEQENSKIALEACYQHLSSSGLKLQQHPDIWQALWTKLIINCAINPFTALLNCPNGEIQQHDLFQSLWLSLKSELMTLMRIAGYPLDKRKLEQLIFEVINNTQHNISSMLQDVRNNKPTEIDHINGFAYQFLAKNRQEHQANQQLWSAVNALRN